MYEPEASGALRSIVVRMNMDLKIIPPKKCIVHRCIEACSPPYGIKQCFSCIFLLFLVSQIKETQAPSSHIIHHLLRYTMIYHL